MSAQAIEKSEDAPASAGGTDSGAHAHEEIVVAAGREPVPLHLVDLWRHRELLFFFAWRDIKVRYKQTLLGASWAILQPLLTMLVFSVILGSFYKQGREGVPFPIFVYSALLPWTFFSYVLLNASNSLVSNTDMISKVYFPRILLPIAASIAGLMDFAIACVVLVGLLVYYQIPPTPALLTAPLFFLLSVVASVAAGIWLSALNVKYRDVRYAIPFLTQIWLYATPIVYPPNLVSGNVRWLFALNPISGIVEGFRWALLGRVHMDWAALIVSCVATAVTVVGGVSYFRRTEEGFADVI